MAIPNFWGGPKICHAWPNNGSLLVLHRRVRLFPSVSCLCKLEAHLVSDIAMTRYMNIAIELVLILVAESDM